jgi:iron complex transport system ATP-binding protein
VVTLLEARALAHEYEGGFVALDGVDLALERGELVCVLGPNGSGKSTLLRVLCGGLVPTGGNAQLEGRPVHTLSARERARRMAVVPQVLEALPDARVTDFVLGGRYPYLGLWGRAREGDRQAVERALAQVDAAGWSKRLLGELSGGQCQRVLLARALAQEAELLFLDEPTAALDPEHQVLLFELLHRLARQDRTALVATHELALAGRFADRVLLLAEGRIVAQGTPEEVLVRDVLEPVYGPHLHYGRGPDAPGGGTRPLVVPWPEG